MSRAALLRARTSTSRTRSLGTAPNMRTRFSRPSRRTVARSSPAIGPSPPAHWRKPDI